MALQLPDSMPWRIYQAYLQGPGALLRLFEDAFGRHALYGPPDPDQQQRTIDALSEQVGQLKTQNERLRAEVSDLRGHNFQLQRRNAELEALVAKDSHNSSRPPSTDPPVGEAHEEPAAAVGQAAGRAARAYRPHVAADADASACRYPQAGEVAATARAYSWGHEPRASSGGRSSS